MNKELKFGTDYQACAHSFAYAGQDDRGENYGSRMYYSDDRIYSYGGHFIIASKIRNKQGNVDFVLFNSNKASNTTSKQQWCVRSAISHMRMIEVDTDIYAFNPIAEIKAKELLMLSSVKLYNKARVDHMKREHMSNILTSIDDIKYLANYYRVKSKVPARIKEYFNVEIEQLLEMLGTAKAKVDKADKAAATRREKLIIKRHKEETAKDHENLKKWQNGELDKIYLRKIEDDYLRLSKDGENVETSQGISIALKEAKRILNLIDKKMVIGAKIDDKFTVTSFNGFLKAGCHNVPIGEINKVRDLV